MRSTLFLLLAFPVISFGGQDELDRDVAKAKIDHAYTVKVCRKKPPKDVQACIKAANEDLATALKGLRQYHLGK